MGLFDILNIAIGIGAVIILPTIKYLFGRFAALQKAHDDFKLKMEKELSAEREQRQRLELMIAREYVSREALKEVMAPFTKDVRNVERMIERIANKLVIPAIHED